MTVANDVLRAGARVEVVRRTAQCQEASTPAVGALRSVGLVQADVLGTCRVLIGRARLASECSRQDPS
jgi:hypothetical protein